MIKNKGTFFSIAAVCLVLGIMLAIQFKTTQNQNDLPSSVRVDELTQRLTKATEERQALAEEVLTLREQLKNVRDYDQAMADLQKELQNSNMAAGMLEVEGPGVVVVLNDSTRPLQPGESYDNVLVHDEDLLNVVNELRASGAECISINGERITAMTEIRCAGTTVLVNWTKIGPPFEIRAIGNPDMLENGLYMRGGLRDQLKIFGVEINVQKQEKIVIPAYSGRVKFEYSRPVEYKEKAE